MSELGVFLFKGVSVSSFPFPDRHKERVVAVFVLVRCSRTSDCVVCVNCDIRNVLAARIFPCMLRFLWHWVHCCVRRFPVSVFFDQSFSVSLAGWMFVNIIPNSLLALALPVWSYGSCLPCFVPATSLQIWCGHSKAWSVCKETENSSCFIQIFLVRLEKEDSLVIRNV